MDATTLAGKVASAIQRTGTQISIRRVSNLAGANPVPNPPTLDRLVVDGAWPAGALSLNLRAAAAVGRLIQGDALQFGGVSYGVAAMARARSYGPSVAPGFNDVQLATPLQTAVSDGTAVSMVWAADVKIYAKITGFPYHQTDGSLIQMRDLLVVIPAYGLDEPQLTWRLTFEGHDYAIISKQPAFAGGTIVKWNLQAR